MLLVNQSAFKNSSKKLGPVKASTLRLFLLFLISMGAVAEQTSNNTEKTPDIAKESLEKTAEGTPSESPSAEKKDTEFVGPQPSLINTYHNDQAGKSTKKLDSMNVGWAVQWVLGLGAVILLIYGLAFILKQHYRPLMVTKHLKAIAWLSVGQRERIAVIQAGDQQFLIGITPQQITPIASINPPIQGESVTAFADHLPSWWKKES